MEKSYVHTYNPSHFLHCSSWKAMTQKMNPYPNPIRSDHTRNQSPMHRFGESQSSFPIFLDQSFCLNIPEKKSKYLVSGSGLSLRGLACAGLLD